MRTYVARYPNQITYIITSPVPLYLVPGASWGGSRQSEPNVWSRGDAASGHTTAGGPGTEGVHGSLHCTPPATAGSPGVRYWGDDQRNEHVYYSVSAQVHLYLRLKEAWTTSHLCATNKIDKDKMLWMSDHAHLRGQTVLSRLATESSLRDSRHKHQ